MSSYVGKKYVCSDLLLGLEGHVGPAYQGAHDYNESIVSKKERIMSRF